MKVCVIGSGGREHSLGRKISQSSRVDSLYFAPGNGGTASLGTNIPISVNDSDGIQALKRELKRRKFTENDLIIVGPEKPLAAGIVDELQGLRVYGPNKRAAQIESSKTWALQLMKDYEIPGLVPFVPFGYNTRERSFRNVVEYIQQSNLSEFVVKADGLAAGKGVFICDSKEEAIEAARKMMISRKLGDAGRRIVIQRRLYGSELTHTAITDGRTSRELETAKDHKKRFDGDKGPNTGGMGAYSPTDIPHDQINRIQNGIVRPTLAALNAEGIVYKGTLYVGLMLTAEGWYVLEFNARLGDPEASVILPRMKSDIVSYLEACVNGNLRYLPEIEWDSRHAVCVEIVHRGYPERSGRGQEITGLQELEKMNDVYVDHCGTFQQKGKVYTNGGRIVSVTALGSNRKEARRRVYEVLPLIHFNDMDYRTDIARTGH